MLSSPSAAAQRGNQQLAMTSESKRNQPKTIELPERRVQDLAQSGGRGGGGDPSVPERYIYKKTTNDEVAFDTSLPRMDCPLIDLELLGSSLETELYKFSSALSSWGCFQVVNHGMSSSSLEEMRGVVKQFFELPHEEKQKCARPIDDFEGYGNDTFTSEDQVLDWTDRMYLMTYPVHKRRLQFWPQKPQAFKEKMHQFSLKMQEILQFMMKAMAKSLSLEDASFLKEYGDDGTILARLNMYPKCPLPDRVLGIHEHTDGSFITILLQDKQVEGLQVLRDGQWFKVPINPDALFINVGDQLEIMSNGIFKSPTHRVVTSAENERISLPMFCCPHEIKEIGPLEELVTEDRPQMYKKVKNYLEIFFRHYQRGESPLSAVRV